MMHWLTSHNLRRTAALIIGIGLALPAGALAATPPEISDQGITDAVADELAMDFAVTGATINVSTTDGVVTLSGTANNLLAKKRSARIARTVKGVRAVVNDIEVLPVVRTDAQIADDVKTALLMDPAADSYEITARVNNGTVTLSGTVESWQERNLAEKVARGVRGVRSVTNTIDIDYDADRTDREIKADIRQKLRWDKLVDGALINVDVNNDNVTLTGVVGSSAEKNRTIVDAWVNGVRTVNADDLRVERWARDDDLRTRKYADKSDENIREAVEDALLVDPRVGSFNVSTDVENGVVTLRGTVEDLKAKRAAAETARQTVGVVSVENRLRVRPADTTNNQRIADRVENAFLIDPYVNRYEISVTVENGIARLYGTVDTFFEKSQADDIAATVDGVIAVDNNLVVSDGYGVYPYDPYVDEWYAEDYDWYTYEPGYTLMSDSTIREEIIDEFFWSPFVDGGDITVTVDDGVATLTGTVDSWSERYAATENALEGGATWVDNELIVQ
jgi:osmotically-inducible protein OsmY